MLSHTWFFHAFLFHIPFGTLRKWDVGQTCLLCSMGPLKFPKDGKGLVEIWAALLVGDVDGF